MHACLRAARAKRLQLASSGTLCIWLCQAVCHAARLMRRCQTVEGVCSLIWPMAGPERSEELALLQGFGRRKMDWYT